MARSLTIAALALALTAPVAARADDDAEDPAHPCGTLAAPTCSLAWLPLASFGVPGLGELIDGRRAWPYAASAAVGLAGTFGEVGAFVARHAHDTPTQLQRNLNAWSDPTGALFNAQPLLVFGELYQTAGFLSAYDTYRHRMVDELGGGAHLSTVPELLAAPIDFRHVLEPGVAIPLAIGVALAVLEVRYPTAPLPRLFTGYRPQDALFTGALSYAAGVGEEAFFRGYLMSLLVHRFHWNRWLANGLQAVVFGLAHGAVDVRIGIGFYLGWLAQHDDYDLTAGVFAHSWWDVVALSTAFATAPPDARQALFVRLPPLSF